MVLSTTITSGAVVIEYNSVPLLTFFELAALLIVGVGGGYGIFKNIKGLQRFGHYKYPILLIVLGGLVGVALSHFRFEALLAYKEYIIIPCVFGLLVGEVLVSKVRGRGILAIVILCYIFVFALQITSLFHSGLQANVPNSSSLKEAFVRSAQQPLTGIGYGNYSFRGLDSSTSEVSRYLRMQTEHPRNIVLLFWLYNGLLGIVGLLSLTVLSIRYSAASWIPFYLIMAVGITANYYTPWYAYVFWVSIGIGVAYSLHATDKR